MYHQFPSRSHFFLKLSSSNGMYSPYSLAEDVFLADYYMEYNDAFDHLRQLVFFVDG